MPSICVRLQQLAAVRAAITSSQITAEASISLSPPDRSSVPINCPAVANHTGTQLIAHQGGHFRLWNLGSHTVQQTWSKPCSEVLPMVILQSTECKYVWSSDDAMVALAFTPWIPEPEDPFSKRKVCTDSDTYSWSGVSHTFVLQLADFSLHNVAERTPWSVSQPVQFVPGSNMLITPWDSLLDGQCHLDVYSPHDWQRVARISHSETGLDARMAFSPDGQLIAKDSACRLARC